MPDTGWTEWSKYVLKELERLNSTQEAIEKRLNSIEVEIGMLKVKAGVWGALAGGVPAVIAIVLTVIMSG